MSLHRALAAEGLGTAFLLAAVVGSGIMGERLAGGNGAIALLTNSIATGAALTALITALGAVSGAHFNPLVTLLAATARQVAWPAAGAYVFVQTIAAIAGVVAAHAMFDEPAVSFYAHARTGFALWWSEFVATFGLLLVIEGCMRHRPAAIARAVGLYIAAAYWFSASTSFANPAVTLARAFTGTFSGIRPEDVPGFVVAQLLAFPCAVFVGKQLFPDRVDSGSTG